MNSIYTGVGSRKTPGEILRVMNLIAFNMANRGFILRSGGAAGADLAFEFGCNSANGKKEIYYARDATYDAMVIAAKFHPCWNACSDYAKYLHGRNAFQVLGRNLNTPANLIICWTPDGCTCHAERTRQTGGTGTAISIASEYGIPVYNLRNSAALSTILNLYS